MCSSDLPPTPIANPGEEAIKAVLNPPETTDLFFVADGTGGHVFARTYEEHLQNVARWREIERRKAGLPPAAPAPVTPETAPETPAPQGQAVITMQAPGAVTPSRPLRPATPANDDIAAAARSGARGG